MKNFLLLSLFLLGGITLFSQIINIPADYSTIQEGIDAANDGDTVLVQPGIYYEHVLFTELDKSIILGSLFMTTNDENYIDQTVIDGNNYGLPCVRFIGNSQSSEIVGFTLQNAYVGSDGYAAAVHINGATAYVKNIIVKDNNSQSGAGTIGCKGSGYLFIKDCEIYNNIGVSLRSVTGNVEAINVSIHDNTGSKIVSTWHGGSRLDFINCLIYNNEASHSCLFTDSPCTFIINSTIANNNSPYGLYVKSVADPKLINTIISGNQQYNVYCEGGVTYVDYSIIEFGADSIYTPYPGALQYGENNLSITPGFVDPANGNYQLNDCNQGIGSGTFELIMAEDTLTAPAYDINYDPRPQPTGSNPDIGAYENPLGVSLTPPSITQQPTGTSQCEGGSHTMTVTAEGSPVISYQWQKDGNDMPGEENNVLILNNLTQADEANYRCLVSNSCETVESNQVYVEVLEAPEFTLHPGSQTKYFGNNVLFEVEASGDDTITYQWYGPSGMLAGENTDQLYLENITIADTGNYYCTATNTCGTETSLSATLTAYEQLVADAGTDIGIALGDSTQLDGSYTGGSPNISISWSPDTLLYSTNVLDPQTVPLFENTYFTLTINDATVGYQSSDTMLVTIITSDSLNYFGPGDDTLYTYTNRAGINYVSGTNADGDKIKAQYFHNTTKTYDLEKVLIRFGKAVKTTEEEVMIKVGVWDDTGDDNIPGSLLDYVNVPLSQIVEDVNNEQMTEAVFESVIETPRAFYVGFFLTQSEGDTLAVYTNIDGQSDPNMAWTLNSEDEWVSYSSDPRFYLRVSNAIFPVVKINNVGIKELDKIHDPYIVYPNPTSGIIKIKAVNSLNPDIPSVRIFDIRGKEVIGFKAYTMNLESLSPGLYIVEIDSGRDKQVSKLFIK